MITPAQMNAFIEDVRKNGNEEGCEKMRRWARRVLGQFAQNLDALPADEQRAILTVFYTKMVDIAIMFASETLLRRMVMESKTRKAN